MTQDKKYIECKKNTHYTVIKHNLKTFTVSDGLNFFECYVRGNLKFNKISIVAGDSVKVDVENKIITERNDRKNYVIRPKMANVDSLIIIMSAKEPDFDIDLLAKYLIFYNHYGITNIHVVISKTDLISDEQKKEIFSLLKQDHTLTVFDSNKDIEKIKNIFNSKIVALSGQSGVGKSTLINKVFNKDIRKTQSISTALNRGKHTTTNVELIPHNGNYIVDTPGFSTINVDFDKHELSKAYVDFEKASLKCKFRNCLHDHEHDCAVKDQVKNNKIAKWKYDFYLRTLKAMK